MMTEEAIIAAIQSGEPSLRNQAIKQVFFDKKTRNKVQELARKYQLSEQDADDVFQDAMVQLDKQIRSGVFRQESKISTYLIRMCQNKLVDLVRKSEKKQRDKEKFKFEQSIRASDIALSPEDQLVKQEIESQKQIKIVLEELLQQLTENCRDTLIKLYYSESTISIKQLANERNIGYQSVKNQSSRCRQKLRKLIEENPILKKLKNL